MSSQQPFQPVFPPLSSRSRDPSAALKLPQRRGSMMSWHASKASFSHDATDGSKQNSWKGNLLAPGRRLLADTENSNPEWRFQGPKLKEMSQSRNHVSVLLLEKLGDTLPMGVPLADELVKGIYDMFGEIAELGVDHRDIRYSNILAAPQGLITLPSLPSPFTGRIYMHRIIDIEQCEKMNGKTWLLTRWQGSWVHRIVDNIPDGIVVEPWE